MKRLKVGRQSDRQPGRNEEKKEARELGTESRQEGRKPPSLQCLTDHSPFNVKFLHAHNPGQRKQRFFHYTWVTTLIETFYLHIICTVFSQCLHSFLVSIEGVHQDEGNFTTILVIQLLLSKMLKNSVI